MDLQRCAAADLWASWASGSIAAAAADACRWHHSLAGVQHLPQPSWRPWSSAAASCARAHSGPAQARRVWRQGWSHGCCDLHHLPSPTPLLT